MKDRHKVITFLEEAELQFEVEKWRIHDLDVWPVIKMVLFFAVQKQHNMAETGRFNYFLQKAPRKLGTLLRRFYDHLSVSKGSEEIFNNLKKSSFLFSSYPGARALHNGKLYSKYFDPLMDIIKGDSIHFDYHSIAVERCYRSDRVVDFERLASGIKVSDMPSLELVNIDKLENLLDDFQRQFGISADAMKRTIEIYLFNTLSFTKKWATVLKAVQPKTVMVLCYYNDVMFGLVAAAKRLNIPVIDMQHGGQGKFHPMYTFAKSNISKLNTIPDGFWLWDRHYQHHIRSWLYNHEHNRAILGGNPWIDFLADQEIDRNHSDKHIVYTMQIGIKPYFPEVLEHAIMNTPEGFKWHIRLHPRMSLAEVSEIKKKVSKFPSHNIYNIKKSNDIPLPTLLKNAEIHVSRFSGSVAEADILNVPFNIVIDKLGKENFPELYAEGRIHFIEPDSNLFYDSISNLKRNSIQTDVLEVDYNKIFEDISKNF